MGELFLFYSSWGHFLTLKVPRPAGRHLARVKEWEACRLSPFHTKCEWRDSGNQTDLSPVDWIWSEAIMLREGGQMNTSELRGIRVAWLWAHDHLISWLKHQRRADLCQTENKGFFFSVSQHHETRRVYASVRRWYSIYSGEDHLYKLVSQVNVLGSKVSEEDVTLKHGDLVWVLLTEQNDHRASKVLFLLSIFSPPISHHPFSPLSHVVFSFQPLSSLLLYWSMSTKASNSSMFFS